MSPVKENFLLIGPWDQSFREIGARILPHLPNDVPLEATHVLGVTVTTLLEKKFVSLYEEASTRHPFLQLVAVVPEGYPSTELLRLHEHYRLFAVLTSTRFQEAEPILYRALEQAQRLGQDWMTEQMLAERQRALESVRTELELDVEKRTRLFTESRHNLLVRSLRLETLRKTLEAIQQAESIPQMEKNLSEVLAGPAEVSWVRVLLSPQDQEFDKQIKPMKEFAKLSLPLWWGSQQIGTAFFMRPASLPFRRDISSFLEKVADAVSLAVDRLQKRLETESLQEQWQITFRAISDPIALINEDYEIVQANSDGLTGGKCYERLFQRTSPCENCGRGQGFRLESSSRTWQVQSQFQVLEPDQPGLYINRYTEITEAIEIEKRMVDLARKIELGTIGSSIAHELNNPLGGILNFAQLLQMDLAKDHPFTDDVREIEAGARRCKDIVENLLAFTRAPRPEDVREIDLREAVLKTLQIQEPRSKSLGLECTFEAPDTPCIVRGHFNLLVQALSGLQTRSMDTLVLNQKNDPSVRGRIEWRLEMSKEEWILTLSDNSALDPARKTPHWTLKTTIQLLKDCGAKLDEDAVSSPAGRAKISFPRPVLSS